MQTAFFFALLSTAVSFAAASIVITPVFEDQIVQKQPGDCFFGVVTPQGCAYVSCHVFLVFFFRHATYNFMTWLYIFMKDFREANFFFFVDPREDELQCTLFAESTHIHTYNYEA